MGSKRSHRKRTETESKQPVNNQTGENGELSGGAVALGVGLFWIGLNILCFDKTGGENVPHALATTLFPVSGGGFDPSPDGIQQTLHKGVELVGWIGELGSVAVALCYRQIGNLIQRVQNRQ